MALVRRLLGAFEGTDMPAPALALRLGKDKKQIYRYERGDDRPPEKLVDELVAMCEAAGIPITPEWIERGRGELPILVVPASVLVPKSEPISAEKTAPPRKAKVHGHKRGTPPGNSGKGFKRA